MIGGKGNKTHNVENLERMHGITDDMETEEDTIDMAMTERFIFLIIFGEKIAILGRKFI